LHDNKFGVWHPFIIAPDAFVLAVAGDHGCLYPRVLSWAE
jgi:hypothetical protein